ncbi:MULTISPECIES: HPr(Ser) kinase/phosphatase [Peptoniphilus]|uniref:HPr(Ser) kinase/phosphatase n=1 Tax=Peptoniphilus TaxID=162289 RepID=UPI0003B84938|nr:MULTISPECIES: HPr(Ser) kinase/phosphatase [Peptoniphilus]ERT62982.1 HPr(Ser) kinase/phosphatase [Peptoniphilus sp. BV3AC2]MDK8277159.1 HPr(Ser) kinase/phosphatase [Peptoniphilus duerdenii]
MSYYTLMDLKAELNFNLVYQAKRYFTVSITEPEVNRPGLQLAGYFRKFKNKRLQMIGNQEWYYLSEMEPDKRRESLDKLFEQDVPAIIFAAGNEVFKEALESAEKYDITIFKIDKKTNIVLEELKNFIDEALAPTTRIHGVLLDVYGVGVILTGDSGVGKSETALDLIAKGSKLISDDSVIIKKMDDRLIGTSPEITKHFMEVRGVGIIDIQRFFGVGSVMEKREVEMIAHLELWDDEKEYVRLGLEDTYQEILGIDVVKYTIPVKPGRHTAMIIEVATNNFKQKQLGYNPAVALNERIMSSIRKRKENQRRD